MGSTFQVYEDYRKKIEILGGPFNMFHKHAYFKPPVKNTSQDLETNSLPTTTSVKIRFNAYVNVS